MTDGHDARFARTVDLYDPEGFARVRGGGVVVAGLGGVGAHAAIALARSGIGRLLLIDCDTLSRTSLNRHPVAGPLDVGRPKVEVVRDHLVQACPDTLVAVSASRIEDATLATLLRDDDVMVHGVLLDAIDSVDHKVALLAHAVGQGRVAVSSLGAAGKVDPGQVRSGTLEESRVCPLGRVVRRGLRRHGVAPSRIQAVWSEEAPRKPDPVGPGGGVPDAFGRHRRQPSNMMLPGMFGFALAALAIGSLAGGGGWSRDRRPSR
ncbi:tRNA threonylcarbamoyladenosine dehydratase [bacterium]|nr:tRNA threonylcarbamoyladenosine dehydratase [bacterium]